MNPDAAIAHYRIIDKLGEGGMGAVYRAADTKLNREVAIKVLPAALANDPDYLARFTREAQVLASLNHPNIAIIHGVEEKALVMELVPGPTLEEMVASGPMAVEEALGIAAQIADALEAAHEKGVIHRDLKPANIKVTPEGVVKVLDFGLAKAAEAGSSAPSNNSPTLTLSGTQVGLILGTAGYMAPEQAAGKPVDRRADIWSFGVVLYELLTGKMLFTGETISHTLASVLKDPIDFDLAQAPPAIRRLLARCLNRNPKERLRDIGEARIAIRSWLANPSAGSEQKASAPAALPKGLRYQVPGVLAAAVAVGLAAALAWMFKPSLPASTTRFTFTLPPDQSITAPNRQTLSISPDGTQMVYIANRRIYLRSLAEFEARSIPGSESAENLANPVFSPDGKSLAFFTGSALKRIPIAGGGPTTIAAVSSILGMTWGEKGILIALTGKGISRISPNGGEFTTVAGAKPYEYFADPQDLPGGEAILFSAENSGNFGLSRFSGWKVVAQNIKTGVRKTVLENASGARYVATGHLVYWSNGMLFAVPFNPRALEARGSPVAVVEGVSPALGAAHFAFSSNGTLIYRPGPAGGRDQRVLARIDRKGDIEPLKIAAGAYGYPRASQDGKQIVFQVDEGKESSIWVWEWTGDAAPRRLTLPGSGVNRYPVLSPDARRVAFQSARDGDVGVWWQPADGSGPPERLTTPDQGLVHIPDSWSPDGLTLSFTAEKQQTSEVWTCSVRDKKATVFATAPDVRLGSSVFSPDGHWIAYQAGSVNPDTRIYLRPFPPTAVAYVAPQDGDSHHPVWSPDGRELFYVPGASQVGSIAVTTKPTVSFGSPLRSRRSGFDTAAPGAVRTFDVLPDGQHFIGVVAAGSTQANAGASEIDIVLGWFEELKQRVPVK